MQPTRWVRPVDLDDALGLVAAGATAAGGCTALLSAAFPQTIGSTLVDLAGLLPANVEGDAIGAGMTLAGLAESAEMWGRWPAVAEAARVTANPNVRRVATVGGTVAARLPAADLFAPLAAYGATVEMIDADEARSMPLVDYLMHPALPPHLVVGVRLTREGPGTYRRFALTEGPAPALATVAAAGRGDGTVEVWAGAVGHGAAPVEFVGDTVPELSALRGDRRASAWYRRQLIEALADEARAELSGGLAA